MAQVAVLTSRPSILTCDMISGAVLEVADLAAARAFYEPIFRDSGGAWEERGDALKWSCAPQHISFVRAAQPNTLPDSAQHQAYRVPPDRLQGLLWSTAGFTSCMGNLAKLPAMITMATW